MRFVKPIDQANYNEVQARVTVQLVALAHKKHPEQFKHVPMGVLNLANRLRAEGICTQYWYMVSLAKGIQDGMSMAEWRDWASTPGHNELRAIHKRRFQPRIR